MNDDTPTVAEVKILQTTLTKKTFQMQLQGLGLIAFEDACKARGETPKQFITTLLDQYLVKEGYLPEWWLKR